MDLQLAFDLSFADLYDDKALARVDGAFVDALGALDADLQARLMAARKTPESLDDKGEADLLLQLAPHLDAFLAKLFGIEDELTSLSGRHTDLEPLSTCQRLLAQPRALNGKQPEDATPIAAPTVQARLAPSQGV